MSVEFLDVADIMVFHATQLARYGGLEGVRNAGLLASAVAMPQATFGGEYLHDGVFSMAAAYAFHIAENQPFVDGNKRAALMAALVFLDLNGVTVADPTGRLHGAMIDLSARRMDKAVLAALLGELASG